MRMIVSSLEQPQESKSEDISDSFPSSLPCLSCQDLRMTSEYTISYVSIVFKPVQCLILSSLDWPCTDVES